MDSGIERIEGGMGDGSLWFEYKSRDDAVLCSPSVAPFRFLIFSGRLSKSFWASFRPSSVPKRSAAPTPTATPTVKAPKACSFLWRSTI